jgi:hypothetical protein
MHSTGETGLIIYRAVNGEIVFEIPPGAIGPEHSLATIRMEIMLDNALGDQYFFGIGDTIGDGMCCTHGQGRLVVYLGSEADTSILIFDGGEHGFGVIYPFVASAAGILQDFTFSPTAAPSLTSSPSVAFGARVPGSNETGLPVTDVPSVTMPIAPGAPTNPPSLVGNAQVTDSPSGTVSSAPSAKRSPTSAQTLSPSTASPSMVSAVPSAEPPTSLASVRSKSWSIGLLVANTVLIIAAS